MVQCLLAALAGALMVSSFAPLEWWFIAPVSMACLFYYWSIATPFKSALFGFCFGFGLFITGVSWVYVSLKIYGGMPTAMGVLAVVLFAGILSFYIALAGYIQAKLFTNKSQRLLIMPFVWVVFEWIKSVLFSGFPWLDIGYTQTVSVLSEYAPVGGVYLVSFMLAMCSALLVLAVISCTARLKAILAISFIIGVAILGSFIEWSKATGEPVSITVVQGNIPITEKWGTYYQNTVISKYIDLSAKYSADLTVWPETALPLYIQQLDTASWQHILPSKGALLTGIVDQPDNNTVYNAAVLYCENNQPQLYRKKHLVPFGEYLPLKFLFNWLLEYLHIPMSDFSSGHGRQPLVCSNNLNIALSICYEDSFAIEVRDGLGEAGILVNISEDAWFGDSLAAHQRLQMARMRALELARPMVRSANTGPSGFINAEGEIIELTEQFKAQAINQAIQPMQGDTMYSRFGNWVVWLSILLLLLLWTRRIK